MRTFLSPLAPEARQGACEISSRWDCLHNRLDGLLTCRTIGVIQRRQCLWAKLRLPPWKVRALLLELGIQPLAERDEGVGQRLERVPQLREVQPLEGVRAIETEQYGALVLLQ
jgi:hypothetical protein